MKRGPLARDDDFVFGTGLGTPMRQSNITRRVWHPLLDSIEVERAGFHRLRHTHASLLLAKGRPVTEVSARLGHKDVRTTLTVYAHALPPAATSRRRRPSTTGSPGHLQGHLDE
jgi:integrase